MFMFLHLCQEERRTWYYGLRAVVRGSITHTVCAAEYPHDVWSTVEATFVVTLVVRLSGAGMLMMGGRRRGVVVVGGGGGSGSGSGGGGGGGDRVVEEEEEESGRCFYRSESGRVVLRKL